MRPFVGVLPAAGLGTRLSGLKYPKELMPVAFRATEDGDGVVPYLVIEHAVEGMRRAGVAMCTVVVSDAKVDLVRYLGDGRELGVDLVYVVQARPLGLAHAVDAALPVLTAAGGHGCLALPDVVYEPLEALCAVCARVGRGANLALGVFPTTHPCELGPVRVGAEGEVRAVYDKPGHTDLYNTWALAAWRPAFGELLHATVRREGPERANLSHIFDEAVSFGLDVRAVVFARGGHHDVGTHRGLGGLAGGRLDLTPSLGWPGGRTRGGGWQAGGEPAGGARRLAERGGELRGGVESRRTNEREGAPCDGAVAAQRTKRVI